MKGNKSKHQKGFVITSLVVIVGAVSLAVSGAKVAETVYERQQTEKIAKQFDEQAQYLSQRAAKMGQSGDEAVKEALRLREAAKAVRKHKQLVYNQKMLQEAAGLAKGLVTGKLVGTAAKGITIGLGGTQTLAEALSDASGIMLDTIGIQDNYNQKRRPQPPDEDSLKLWEIIKGSRTNVDEFELARLKATTDSLIASYKRTIKEAEELEGWLEAREAVLKELEEGKKRRAAARLAAAANEATRRAIQKSFQKGTVNWQQVFSEVAKELKKPKTQEVIEELNAGPSVTPGIKHRQISGRGSWGKSSFRVSFPSQGGPVSGSIAGFCRGSVGGSYTFNGIDGGRISGSMKGKCGSGKNTCSASGGFSGTVYLKKGYASGRWSGSCSGESIGGSWRINFTPLEE